MSKYLPRNGTFWILLATLALFELVRSFLVWRFFAHDMDEHGFFVWMTLKHDAALIGAVLSLHLASGWLVRPWALLLRLGAWILMCICVADLLVFAQFARRLRFNDLLLFGSEGDAIGSTMRAFLSDMRNLPLTAVVVLTLLSLAAVWARPSALQLRTATLGTLTGVFLVGCSLLPDRSSYNNAWVYRNIAEIQLMSGVLKPYGPSSVAAARQWSEGATPQCEAGLDSRRNVIVLLWESLSARHSQYLSGLSDWTPQFDAYARQHHVWNNFYANGNNTAWGYVASLTGHDPLLALNVRNFQRWTGVADALPYPRQAGWLRLGFSDHGRQRLSGSGQLDEEHRL